MNYCYSIPDSILPAVRRMIIIGDIHGSWKALVNSLKLAEVIKEKTKENGNKSWSWIGGDTHVIQIGDLLDRGGRGQTHGDEKSEDKIIKFLLKLQKKAKKKNGALHLLLGNHEIMNVMGDFRYVSPMGMTDFKGERKESLKPGGEISKKLACNSHSILKIGSWVFSHAGILPKISKKFSITEVNRIVREFLLGNTVLDKNSDIVDLFWHRTYAGVPNCKLLQNSLDDYSSKYAAIGHSVQSNINSVCEGSLWRVDVGMSDAFGKTDKIEILEILHDGADVRLLNLG